MSAVFAGVCDEALRFLLSIVGLRAFGTLTKAARAREIKHPRVVRKVTTRLQSQSSDNARMYKLGRAYANPPDVLRVRRTGFRLGRAANVNVALARAAMVVVAVLISPQQG